MVNNFPRGRLLKRKGGKERREAIKEKNSARDCACLSLKVVHGATAPLELVAQITNEGRDTIKKRKVGEKQKNLAAQLGTGQSD